MKQGYNTRKLHSSLFLHPLQLMLAQKSVCLQALPFQQFHVLFHSLFKVLFIFPSRYLFAIGLSPIFSFRWNLPPTLSCIPKQLDSLAWEKQNRSRNTGLSPSKAPCSKGLFLFGTACSQPTNYNSLGISNLSFCRFTRRY